MSPATELAQYADFVIQYSAASNFASPTTIGRVSQLTINDQFDVVTIDDFDQAVADIADQVLGARSVNITTTLNLKPSGAGLQALHAAKKAATRHFWGIDAVDTETSTTTLRMRVGGWISNFSVSLDKPIATVSITFVADEIVSDDVS